MHMLPRHHLGWEKILESKIVLSLIKSYDGRPGIIVIRRGASTHAWHKAGFIHQ
jgi:hypothetical protein